MAEQDLYDPTNVFANEEDDELGRAVLMKKLNQASFCGVDNHQEDVLSRKMIFKINTSLLH